VTFVTEKLFNAGYNIITIKRKEVVIMSVLAVNKQNFESVVNSEKPVLLDFYADWCGPCRMVSPLVDEIAEENPQYLVGKINVDNEPELAAAFSVSSIPMLVAMKDGKVVNYAVGARPKEQILDMLK
jgi:thioredoxin 1